MKQTEAIKYLKHESINVIRDERLTCNLQRLISQQNVYEQIVKNAHCSFLEPRETY